MAYYYDEHNKFIDSTTFLLRRGIVMLDGTIGNSDAYAIYHQLFYLKSRKEKEVQININSYGGSVHAGLSIYDALDDSGLLVKTVCLGTAMSMAAVLLAAGSKGERYATKHSRIMIHQVSSGGIGSVADLEIQTKETVLLNKVLIELIAKATKKSSKRVKRDMDRDFFMSAEEAKAYGLIDHIL